MLAFRDCIFHRFRSIVLKSLSMKRDQDKSELSVCIILLAIDKNPLSLGVIQRGRQTRVHSAVIVFIDGR